jgi:PKD repeat protein
MNRRWHTKEGCLEIRGCSLKSFCALICVAVAMVTLVLPASAQSPATVGQWSAVINTNYESIHTHLLPTGKLFYWSIQEKSLFPQLLDPATNNVTPAAAAGYQVFCSGHSFLADGRLFVSGGNLGDLVGVPNASIYDPLTNTWTRVPDMNAGRWYPTNTTLPSGDVLVVSGTISGSGDLNTLPQVWQASLGTWRNLTSAQLALPLYPRMIVAPNGKVFYATPDQQSRYLDTSGTGSWSASARSNFGYRDYSSVVLYDTGKILMVGGGDPPTATAETIDLTAATPTWKYVGSMAQARRQLNATILPDGKVLITGGSSGPGLDDAAAPVYLTEMWDPATGNFTPMASITKYRGYHSVSVLLPDGRVYSGGGDVSGATAEIFSPPYLFKGARPSISSAPPRTSYGGNIFVGTPDASTISQVNVIRLASVTHSFNQDQRIVHLSFSTTTGGLNITAPANANLAPPGFYLLFLVNSNGVPAIGQFIQLTSNLPPVAVASAAPTSGPAPLSVSFTGSGSSDPDGTVVGYSWNFGDGQTSTQANPTHQFATAQTYTVTLTVTDNGGATGSTTLPITATLVNAPPPTLSSVTPNAGTQGVTLNVVLGGANFQSGAACSFGAGVTVHSCLFNTSAQLTANVSIAAAAAVGPRDVTITNPDAQSGTLSGAFTVTLPPQVTSVTPNSAAQGQTLNVVVQGNNFQPGAACSFGGGITANACTFNSSTQITATLSIGATAFLGARDVTITNPDTKSGTLSGGFSVTQAVGGNLHIDFSYPSRTALLADGWDFNAKTAAGAIRNTEQTGASAVDYDQTVHPGMLRVPILKGDIYRSSNNSLNTLLRDLPSDWTSIRLKIAAFTPAANYQQVDLVAYQDDDNYVIVSRMMDGVPTLEFYREQAAVVTQCGHCGGYRTLTNTGNLLLRLDRNAATNVYSGFFSTDGGTTWISTGTATQALSSPRLAIHAGANAATTQPTADLAWVEILR